MEYGFNENACQEAYVIVNYLLENGELVVPQKILNTLEKERNINHNFDLNDINKRALHPDTEKILTEVYLECIATQSEKNKICKAVDTLNKVIAKDMHNNKNTSLATVSFGDKLKHVFFSPIKIKI